MQTRTHCCGHIVAHDVSWAAQTGKHLLRTQNFFWTKSVTFFVSQTQNVCPQQMLRVRANGETFVSATMCPQQCVLVCQGLKIVRALWLVNLASRILLHGPLKFKVFFVAKLLRDLSPNFLNLWSKYQFKTSFHSKLYTKVCKRLKNHFKLTRFAFDPVQKFEI